MTRNDENTERLHRLRTIVQRLPDKPGSYQFHDKNNEIIYVGKAKNLRNRVASYFHREVDRHKTAVLVSKIWDISYTVVSSEEDALLLENALIKQYKPRYNVLLKDGKTYPSICISGGEALPRVYKTRRIRRGAGQEYYGPYSHVPTMYALLDIINKMCQPRRCNIAMTIDGVQEGRYRACLEYHIKNCKAPCVGRQTQDDYLANIAQAREILRGNTQQVARSLREKMQHAAAALRFEEAEEWKEKYLLLTSYVAKSEVVSHTISNIDVFSATEDTTGANVFINYLHVMEGQINQSFTLEYHRKMDESVEELLLMAIPEIRARYHSTAKEIVVPLPLDWRLPDGAVFVVPQRGDKKHLLDLSAMNGRQYLFDRLKQREKLNPEQRQTRLMKELQQALALPKLPYHIECFDNSHIAGTDAVSCCVVFKGLRPAKKEYRHYNIRCEEGKDDYAAMQEVVLRRYQRLCDEGAALPDLILCDGGVGHLHAVRSVIEEQLGLDIAVAGLAKDSRHRTNELLFGDPVQTVALPTTGDLFRTLALLQDEMHRFVLSFHRDKRSRHALRSALDEIPGVGPRTQEVLLRQFRSVKRIREAEETALAAVIGAKKGHIVYAFFHSAEDSNNDETT